MMTRLLRPPRVNHQISAIDGHSWHSNHGSNRRRLSASCFDLLSPLRHIIGTDYVCTRNTLSYVYLCSYACVCVCMQTCMYQDH